MQQLAHKGSRAPCFKQSKAPPATVLAARLASRLAQRSGQRAQQQVCFTATSTVSSAQTVQALRSWSQSRGLKLDKVEVTTDLKTEKPVLVAANDLSAGETVLTIPDSAWLNTESINKTKLGKALEGQEPWLQVALTLMADRAAAASGAAGSEWSAYTTSLPDSPASPLAWSPAAQAQLAGTQVAALLQSYAAFFQATWRSISAPGGLVESSPVPLLPPGVAPSSPAAYQAFLWAVAHVRARAHAPLGEGASLALVPVADLVLHRRTANTKWVVKSAGLFGKGQVLALEATRALRKGDALSLDYGPGKLDGPVLLDSGAVDAFEPREGYSITLTIPESDRFQDDKLDVLEGAAAESAREAASTSGKQPGLVLLGDGRSATWVLRADGDGAPPPEMLGFLRLKHLSSGDAFLLESIFRQDCWSFMMEPVSETNEATLCREMAAGARAALAAYPTTLDDDEALLAAALASSSGSSSLSDAAALSPEALAALRVRLGEKRALANAAAWFEERLTRGLKSLAYYQERRLRRLGLVDDEGRTTYDSFFKDGIA